MPRSIRPQTGRSARTKEHRDSSSVLGRARRCTWARMRPCKIGVTADLSPVRQLLVTLAGWVNRHQQQVIEYWWWRRTAKGQRFGRRVLRQVATIVSPDTILRWHRRLIAGKSEAAGTPFRRSGRTDDGALTRFSGRSFAGSKARNRHRLRDRSAGRLARGG